MVTAVTSLVSGVVNAILSPFAASNTPGTPAATPSIWSLLAFARREFENAFTAPSLSARRVDTQTTGQTLAEPGQRTLILTAFPAEADAILARTTLDPNPSVVVDAGTSFGMEPSPGFAGPCSSLGLAFVASVPEAALESVDAAAAPDSSAHARPLPHPVTMAAPTPRATANPPTRPTYALPGIRYV